MVGAAVHSTPCRIEKVHKNEIPIPSYLLISIFIIEIENDVSVIAFYSPSNQIKQSNSHSRFSLLYSHIQDVTIFAVEQKYKSST